MRRACLVALLACGCATDLDGPPVAKVADPFADRVVRFAPGANAGFGQAKLPCIALGSPRGVGDLAGSLDVVSLGNSGTIEVAFDDIIATDGPGPDLLVFENPFKGYVETGRVSASADGVVWLTWPCDPQTGVGCAGVHPVFAAPGNGISATDPAVAGGDGFDLAAIGLKTARFVRIEDSGANQYQGNSGGFDLDAVAVVHGHALKP